MQISTLLEGNKHPLWPQISKLLEPAARRGGVPVWEDGDVLWVMFDGPTIYGAATSRNYNEAAELVHAGGTRFREWMPLLDEAVTSWARDCGAPKLVMSGRKGWARFAERHRWVPTEFGKEMFFEKELR